MDARLIQALDGKFIVEQLAAACTGGGRWPVANRGKTSAVANTIGTAGYPAKARRCCRDKPEKGFARQPEFALLMLNPKSTGQLKYHRSQCNVDPPYPDH